MNLRSRTGCLACKKRKRRCGEERPACRNCVVRGVTCPYLSTPTQPVSVRFKICQGNVRWRPRRDRRNWHFLSLSSREVGMLSAEHGPPRVSLKEEEPPVDDLYASLVYSMIPGPCLDLLSDCTSLEKQLFQYYLQVISKVRVFQDDSSNLFRSLVVPLCSGQRPLLYAVLSVSANDRRGDANLDYGRLSLSYKSRALRLLRQSLPDMHQANEALMTCLILCSLEIASGSRTDWVRHVRGAFAIIHSFAAVIDPQILFFVYSYFQCRAIFFLTTTGFHGQADGEVRTTLQWSPEVRNIDNDATGRNKIQPHMGCSLSLLDIISQTTRLVQRKRQHRQSERPSLAYEESIRSEAMSIRSHLDSLEEENPSGNEYLATCAECFRVAADLFLQLACDIPLYQPALQEHLRRLLNCIGRVVHENQERQLFPMWPLFLAGCLAGTDEDRLGVLDYFAVLGHQWPISNIPVVREATETIWKSRDLNPEDKGGRDGLDWQMIIDQMDWKLALS